MGGVLGRVVRFLAIVALVGKFEDTEHAEVQDVLGHQQNPDLAPELTVFRNMH